MSKKKADEVKIDPNNNVGDRASLDGVVELTIGGEKVNCRVSIEKLDKLEMDTGKTLRQLIADSGVRGLSRKELYAILECMAGKSGNDAKKFFDGGTFPFRTEKLINEAFSMCVFSPEEIETFQKIAEERLLGNL